MYCSNCGSMIQEGQTYCPNCGEGATAVQPVAQQVAQTAPQAATQPAIQQQAYPQP